MKILLDTNFCITLEKKAWILEELKGNEIIITDFIKKEIIKVSKKPELIFELLKKHNVKIIKTPYKEDNDEALIKTAQKDNASILTNDLELRKKAQSKKVQIHYLRHNSKIQKG